MADHVVLITDPAGAGKSAVARELASRSSESCAHLSLDIFREMVKSGFLDPRDGWNDETQRQLDLARDNVASVAKNYLDSGIAVIIDDVVFPACEPSGLDRWVSALSPCDVNLIVLFPSWWVIADRNRGRSDHDRLPEKMLKKIFDDMQGWRDQSEVAVIDSSNLSIAETASRIELLLIVKTE